MSVQTILQDFSREDQEGHTITEMEAEIDQQLRKRRDQLTQVFEETILPSVYSVERDLQQAGYWHVLQLQQTGAEGDAKPNIVGVLFFFYPEKYSTDQYNPRMLDAAYRAEIFCSEDFRKISLAIAFPIRFPPKMEVTEKLLLPEEVTTDRIDAFLEDFVKGAIDAYRSDRTLI